MIARYIKQRRHCQRSSGCGEYPVKSKETISLCSFSVGQWALAEFLGASEDYLREARGLCRKNMERTVERLRAIPGVRCTPPRGRFYVFRDFSEIEPSSQMRFERLLEGDVAVVPGIFFGSEGKGRCRIRLAAPYNTLSMAMDRLEAVLRSYVLMAVTRQQFAGLYLVVTERCPWSEHYGVFGATRLGEEPVLSLPKESVPEGARFRCLRPLGRVRKIERPSLRTGQKLCTERVRGVFQ